MALIVNSQYIFSPNIWPIIIASLFLLILAIFGFRNRQMPGALPFSIACIFGLLWTIGTIFEFSAVNMAQKIFWRKYQVMFQLPSATAITCFLLEYTWPKRWLTRRNLILLSIIPLLVILSILTNNAHYLFWKGFVMQAGELVAIDGSLMKYFFVYVYLDSILNLIILAWLFTHSKRNRWPAAIIIMGQIIMRLLYFIDVADRVFINFPLSSIGIAFTSMMYGIVLFRFRILGPIPLARQAVVAQLPIGILVLDDQGKIRKLNPIAEQMLKITSKDARGLNIKQVLPIYPQKLLNGDQADVDELDWDFEDGDRHYRLNLSILKDWRDFKVGQLLMLEDVTNQRVAQKKILEQQRVMATLQERELISRELHDDLAQVFTFIDTQGQTIQRLLDRGDLEMADKHLIRLIEAARNGEVDIREAIRGMRLTLSEKGLLVTLKDYLDVFETNTSIQTELIKPDIFNKAEMSAMVEVQLLRIIQEALTNIRKHANASKVKIQFSMIDTSLCVAVQDNGQGFTINEGALSPQNHYGLLMMQERAAAIGGKINLSSQPGQGTEINVCVPTNERMAMDE